MNRLLAFLPKQAQLFVILVLLMVLTQFLGQAGTVLVGPAMEGQGVDPTVAGIAEFLLALACAGLAFGIGCRCPRPSRGMAALKAGFAVIAVVASNTALNSLGAAFQALVGPSRVAWGLALLVLIGVWAWAALDRLPAVQKWFHAQVDRKPGDARHVPQGHVVLVMLVSHIDEESLDLAADERSVTVRRIDPSTRAVTDSRRLGCEALAADIEALAGTKWSWQQLMRGIAPFTRRSRPGDRLTILLVGSSGAGGSYPQLEKCRQFLRRYPELSDVDAVAIERSMDWLGKVDGQGVDFEDFNAVKSHVFAVVVRACAEVGDNRVFVDVTGGQTPTSIAAAVATTGETGFCQYVQTNDPCGVVRYDLHPPEMPSI